MSKTTEVPMKQVSSIEETETIILIDYHKRTFSIYSTRATVCNRIERLGYKASRVDKMGKKEYGKYYEFPTSDIGKFLRTGIFKFD